MKTQYRTQKGEAKPSIEIHGFGASASVAITGIRILYLNMRHSAKIIAQVC